MTTSCGWSTRDGAVYLEIGVVVTEGGRRRVRWQSRRLTDAQAADLVIRTGGGNDLLGLGRSPEAVSFDAYLEAYLNRDRLPGEDDGDPVVDDLTRFDRSYAYQEWVSYGQANVVGGDYGAPVVTLQHELPHAWDHLHEGAFDIHGRTYTETRHFPDGRTEDRVAPRPELNSVGLDLDGDGDIDTVGAGDGTDHPTYVTENALRTELGMRRRTSYEWGTFEGDDRITYGDTDD